MYKITLTIDGMSCGMCEAHLNDTIRGRYSVKKLKSSHRTGTTEFLSEEIIPENELKDLIDPTGYRLVGYSTETVQKRGLFR